MKIFFIIIILLAVTVLGWAGLTKAGYIYNYLEIEYLCPEQDKSDSSETSEDINTQPMYGKPVIYLYPQQKQEVNVELNFEGNLTVSYPEYNNGWNVIAHPDGKIINTIDNREYSYLFWEGLDENANYDLSSGFIVPGTDTTQFFQEKLSEIGLTANEYNEFIVYWLPLMQNNNYNLIHFATKEEYSDRVKLDINPKPESELRVFMVYQKLENNTLQIEPQELESFTRNGFTVVEWGGTEI